MLRKMKTVIEYFSTELNMSNPQNLFAEAGMEISDEDTDTLRDLGRDAMDAIGITYDSRGLMKPWNTLMGIMYDKGQSLTES